jgi:hypothetical protein
MGMGTMRPDEAEREIARLRLGLARAEGSAAFTAARVAGRLGNQLADASYASRRLAEAVRSFLEDRDATDAALREALTRWENEDRRQRQYE